MTLRVVKLNEAAIFREMGLPPAISLALARVHINIGLIFSPARYSKVLIALRPYVVVSNGRVVARLLRDDAVVAYSGLVSFT